MQPLKLLAIALIVAGAVGLAYGGFSFTRSSSTADLGPVSLTVKEREHVNIPVWAGAAAIVGGVLLLFGSGSGSRAFRSS